jgi:hypothetical protein
MTCLEQIFEEASVQQRVVRKGPVLANGVVVGNEGNGSVLANVQKTLTRRVN